MLSTHPQAQWLFRATLSTAAPFKWTNLLPVVEETGLGDFCLPSLVAPAEFAGQRGLVQVIQDAADGVLYQCAAINFIAGVNSTVGAGCKNVTGLTATIPTNSDFNTTEAGGASSSASASMTMSMTGSATSATAAATSSSGAAAARMANRPSYLSSALLTLLSLGVIVI